jgi:hypothetical protein
MWNNSWFLMQPISRRASSLSEGPVMLGEAPSVALRWSGFVLEGLGLSTPSLDPQFAFQLWRAGKVVMGWTPPPPFVAERRKRMLRTSTYNNFPI